MGAVGFSRLGRVQRRDRPRIGITLSAGIWGYILQHVPSKLLLSTGLLVNAISVAVFAVTQNGTVWAPLWVARWADEEKLPLWINLSGCVAAGVGNGVGMLLAGSSTANGLPYAFPFQVEEGGRIKGGGVDGVVDLDGHGSFRSVGYQQRPGCTLVELKNMVRTPHHGWSPSDGWLGLTESSPSFAKLSQGCLKGDQAKNEILDSVPGMGSVFPTDNSDNDFEGHVETCFLSSFSDPFFAFHYFSPSGDPWTRPAHSKDRKIRCYSDDLLNSEPPSRQTSEAKGRPRIRSGSFLHPVIVAEDMTISQQLLGRLSSHVKV
eukprot:Skav214454  [mRNA]  locus=scaffold1870:77890:80866:+ [translate_table: standard]